MGGRSRLIIRHSGSQLQLSIQVRAECGNNNNIFPRQYSDNTADKFSLSHGPLWGKIAHHKIGLNSLSILHFFQFWLQIHILHETFCNFYLFSHIFTEQFFIFYTIIISCFSTSYFFTIRIFLELRNVYVRFLRLVWLEWKLSPDYFYNYPSLSL